jgi:phenylacetate-CoA ligase
VLQTEHGVEVLAIAGESVRDVVPALVLAMQRHGVADPSIRIRSVETLGRNPASGKLKRFVPLSS